MKHYFITFRSVTYAQRGEQALNRVGINCKIQRAPRMMEERGCGYSLSIGSMDVFRGIEVLKAQQIPFRKVYFRQESGELEEVVL